MNKIKYKDLGKEEKAFIKTKVNTILFNAWIEKEFFMETEMTTCGYEDIKYESGYYRLHAKYKNPVIISLILLSPLVFLFYALVALMNVVVEIVEDYHIMPEEFKVCNYRRDRFIKNDTCPHGYTDWDECPVCCH